MERVTVSKSKIIVTLLLLVLVGLFFCFFLSLLSYHPSDPGWSQTALNDTIYNFGGYVGAYIADISFQFLGYIAYAIPIFGIMTCLQLMLYVYEEQSLSISYFSLAFRLIGLFALIVSACGFCALNVGDTDAYPSGGNIGDIVENAILSIPMLESVSASFLLLMMILASISLLTDCSWPYLFEVLGAIVLNITAKVASLFTHLFYKLTDIDPKQNRIRKSVHKGAINSQFANSYYNQHNNMYDYDYEDDNDPAYLQFDPAAVGENNAGAQNINRFADDYPNNDSRRHIDNAYENPAYDDNRYNPNYAQADEQATHQYVSSDQHREVFAREQQVPRAPSTGSVSNDLAISIEERKRIESQENIARFIEEEMRVSSSTAHVKDIAKDLSIADKLDKLLDIAKNEALVNKEMASKPIRQERPTNPSPMERPRVPFDEFDVLPDIASPDLALHDTALPDITLPNAARPSGRTTTLTGSYDDYREPRQASPMPEQMNPYFADDAAFNEDFSYAEPQNDPDEPDGLDYDALIHPLLQRNEKQMARPTTPLPSLDLLTARPSTQITIDHTSLSAKAELIEQSLADFRVKTKVVDYQPGPVITRFEIELAPGIKASRISTLDRDLARSLSMPSVRVVEVIPGKPYVGIELPNENRQTVYFREVLDSQQFRESQSPLTIVLGKDIAGQSVVADLAKMPHVLVAGTTGSGKSVGVNAMILSILYKSKPDDVRFIMIDPKMLELSVYEGIPHLLTPVVTDMKDAANALNWCVNEMERRYKLMSVLGVRNIAGYNEKVKQAEEMGHPIPDPLWKPTDSMDINMPSLEKLPYIVVMVDEFADLIMAVGKKVEDLIARLAQKARAAGIHLVLATQRPSVDVITGLIKANIPTRIAFTVSSKIDSRTILDQMGAESLLGMGDMLYLPPNSSIPSRVHGAFVRDEEVHAVVQDWKARGEPKYIENITTAADDAESSGDTRSDEELDPLFDKVVDFVIDTRQVAVTRVQRKFFLGYNRAARIMEQMEKQGIVSAPNHKNVREILVPSRK